MEGLWSENGGGAPAATTGVLASSLLLSHVMISLARHLPGGKNTHSKWISWKGLLASTLKDVFALSVCLLSLYKHFVFLLFHYPLAAFNSMKAFLEVLVACLHFASHANNGFWFYILHSWRAEWATSFQIIRSCLSNFFFFRSPLVSFLSNCPEGVGEQVPGPGRSKVACRQRLPTMGQLWSIKQKQWGPALDQLLQFLRWHIDNMTERQNKTLKCRTV